MDGDYMHAENAAMSNSWRDQLRQQRLWLVVLLVLGLSREQKIRERVRSESGGASRATA